MKLGDYKTFPYFEIIGSPNNFYIWIQLGKPQYGWAWYEPGKQGASDWLRGSEAFTHYNKLQEFFKKKDLDKFKSLATHLHRTNKGKEEYENF